MKRIVVIGGNGFIGRNVVRALTDAGQEVTAPFREDFDIAQSRTAALAAKLEGADIVVNCAGLARDSRLDNLEAVHVEGVRRIAEACGIAGVKRLIQISTLGAGSDDVTRLQRTKGEAEEALRAVEGLEVSIVRPSIVIGPGGAASDFFGALAALPLAPRLGPGTWKIQPLHISELVTLVTELALRAEPVKTVDAVGPEPMTTDELQRGLRAWLGLKPALGVPMPRGLLNFFAFANEIVEVGPGDRDLLSLLERGNTSDPAGITAALGRPPRPVFDSLARRPATLADLWRARLFFIQPIQRIGMALLWMGAGFASLGLYPPSEFTVMLSQVGIHGEPAQLAIFGTAILNLGLGFLMLVNWQTARIALAMIVVVAVYTGVALLLPSEYWLNPFAPILKNIPIAVALLSIIAMEPPRS